MPSIAASASASAASFAAKGSRCWKSESRCSPTCVTYSCGSALLTCGDDANGAAAAVPPPPAAASSSAVALQTRASAGSPAMRVSRSRIAPKHVSKTSPRACSASD